MIEKSIITLISFSVLVVVIYFLRFRIITIVQPLFKKMGEEYHFVEQDQIVKGVNALLLSFAFSMMLVLWFIYLSFFDFDKRISCIIIFIILLVIVVFSLLSFRHFVKAFRIANEVHAGPKREHK
ncbi:hypothetical protein D6745_05560 [Candidatus Woesearchaeota archaeon]|nr:MAG: hypothetical protein D6745_05560 [Candidatus Woesearchaeota archaeon]